MDHSIDFRNVPIVVIDGGTGCVPTDFKQQLMHREIKAGFCGHDKPILREPCILARKPIIKALIPSTETCFGHQAIRWDIKDKEVVKVFAHPFHPSVTIRQSHVLDMYQMWNYVLEVRLVVDVGESSTRVIPVVEDSGIDASAIFRTQISGYLASLVLQEVFRCSSHPAFMLNLGVIDEIKQSACRTRLNFDYESTLAICKEEPIWFPLPLNYGNMDLRIALERYLVPEIFFHPEIFVQILPGRSLTHKSDSILKIIMDSIKQCAMDLRNELLANVIVVGGTSNTPDFVLRLDKELIQYQQQALGSSSKKCKPCSVLHADNPSLDRGLAVFMGACIIGEEWRSFPSQWILREEFLSNQTAATIRANQTAIGCGFFSCF
ncbi:putative actin-like protein [Cardiosporidium cionae]|uniref:Actin-like protein n=1 Tax=Cardiosporidium cionae TaxID=476202 RepID=A0ABQ7J5N6_9APIC|nr:putative actin-like protein [Cardiosporidium cionae]|eukprot:KAF8819320.1 putative actin-like protein [Cardiosporidium cionae]